MTRTKGSLAWKIFVGVLAVILILILVAEFGLRAYVSNRIESEFAAAAPVPTTADPQVAFGSQPLTLGLLAGTVPHMALSVPSTLVLDGDSFTGQPAATINVDKVRRSDGGFVADTLDVTTELPDAFIQAILQQQVSTALSQVDGLPAAIVEDVVNISGVTSNPETGTVTIQFNNGLAGIDLRPQRDGDSLTFTADSTSLFGIDLPGGVAQRLSEALRVGMQDAVFGPMRVRDVTVIDGGLLVSLNGHDVNLNQISEAL
ncbi:LmeA family phospholipid-binding protein [Corynebacterium lipophiloflavum]|uniref:DUF2993 domain-containing protein n=1 Tax=Corynebacterium lipophiloflavum (strain ATCC 700352 / DSM 44291 / CCUG 37336 / JCM 10383 / DMMZ 1944) TaxID=525263 RepID=C0XUC4_CORLD|nr:DUF2993 domain-containing protein [Corynebacterium lipophiloflavum]EEI16190.1 hypothetical protein HMPREF0298_2044 [Corynebacterium lipophiloflavum DSM 44291]